MERENLSYDEETGVLRYAMPGEGALDPASGRELSAISRSGEWEGHRVSQVRVRFRSEDEAKKQADAMAFLSLVAETPGGDPLEGSSFATRTDFGIDES